jgi:hypothetical protein
VTEPGGFLLGGTAGYSIGLVTCMTGSGGGGTVRAPGTWKITNPSAKKVINGKTYLKDPKTGTWWSKDFGGHGGSAWKVFREVPKGLEWIADADEQGNFIIGKHKSPVGLFIEF